MSNPKRIMTWRPGNGLSRGDIIEMDGLKYKVASVDSETVFAIRPTFRTWLTKTWRRFKPGRDRDGR